MQQPLVDFLHRRKQRTIASILSVKERDVDPHLPEHVRRKLRKVILDQVNELYDAVFDVAASLDSGDIALNEEYLRKIDDLHAAIVDVGEDATGLLRYRLRESAGST